MKRLINYMLQGLLFIAPLAITLYIIYQLFNVIDGILKELLIKWFDIYIPGLGILIIILLLMLIGFLGKTILGRPLKAAINKLQKRVPLLKLIYSAFNDLFSAFVGKERKFNRPVLVLVNPISNLEKLGFLTEEDLSRLNEKDKVAVYFPHSYNFSGELFIVPRENVRPIDISPSDVMKFIVTAGVAGWDEIENTTEQQQHKTE